MNRALNIPVKISEPFWRDPSFDKERFLTSQFVRAIAGHEDCTTFTLSVEVVANEVA